MDRSPGVRTGGKTVSKCLAQRINQLPGIEEDMMIIRIIPVMVMTMMMMMMMMMIMMTMTTTTTVMMMMLMMMTFCPFCSYTYLHNPGPCILSGRPICVEWASFGATIAPKDSF